MDLSIVYSRALTGLEAPLVRVETHLSNGLPAFHIVGMPETAVRESKDRVRSAILNSHFDFPDRRITVNLAPADLPKEGGRFDLPIALGILTASGQVPENTWLSMSSWGNWLWTAVCARVPAHWRGQGSQRSGRAAGSPAAGSATRRPSARKCDYCRTRLAHLCAHLNGSDHIAAQQASRPRSPATIRTCET